MNRVNKNITEKTLGLKGRYIYLITICKYQVKDFVQKYELENVLKNLYINKLGSEVIIDNIVYEISPTYKQLHLHCILYSKRNFRYNRFTKDGSFKVHFRRVYNLGTLKGYLLKQSCNTYSQDQTLIENYYNHHYGFN